MSLSLSQRLGGFGIFGACFFNRENSGSPPPLFDIARIIAVLNFGPWCFLLPFSTSPRFRELNRLPGSSFFRGLRSFIGSG